MQLQGLCRWADEVEKAAPRALRAAKLLIAKSDEAA